MSKFYLGGWREDLEDSSFITNLPDEKPVLELVGSYKEVSLDPREVLKVENQGSVGSCFPAGHKVTLSNGNIKNIEDVVVSDSVITHKSRAKSVSHIMSRKYNGNLYEFFVKGWGKIKMTHDHICRIYRDGECMWVKAEDIKESDNFIISKHKEDNLKSVKISDYCPSVLKDGDKINMAGCRNWTKDEFILDELNCFILGLFCAEGSTDSTKSGTKVRSTFTLNSNELGLGEKIKRFSERLDLTVTSHTKKNAQCTSWRIQSAPLAYFLENVCGKYCNFKEVPHFIMTASEENKKAFLLGYTDGDGSYQKIIQGRKNKNGEIIDCNQICSSTASRVLSQQISTLFCSLGYKAGRSFKKKRENQRFDVYSTYLYSKDACDFVGKPYKTQHALKSNKRIIDCEEGQFRKIRSIKVEPVKNLDVYDITVEEDHSFVCQGLIVHNCQGHSISSVVEWCYCIATGKYDIQLSRAYGYYESQRLDNIRGDMGSTISSGVRLATTVGIPEEKYWPYIARYNNNRPNNWTALLKSAEMFKAANSRRLTSYDGIRTFLGSGQGGINIGIGWGNGMNASVLERYSSGGGGHAISLVSLSDRKDRNGDPYVWMMNSWGERWGNGGWAEWSPNAIRQMTSSNRTVAIGVSDLPNVKPRELTREDWINNFRLF